MIRNVAFRASNILGTAGRRFLLCRGDRRRGSRGSGAGSRLSDYSNRVRTVYCGNTNSRIVLRIRPIAAWGGGRRLSSTLLGQIALSGRIRIRRLVALSGVLAIGVCFGGLWVVTGWGGQVNCVLSVRLVFGA